MSWWLYEPERKPLHGPLTDPHRGDFLIPLGLWFMCGYWTFWITAVLALLLAGLFS